MSFHNIKVKPVVKEYKFGATHTSDNEMEYRIVSDYPNPDVLGLIQADIDRLEMWLDTLVGTAPTTLVLREILEDWLRDKEEIYAAVEAHENVKIS